MQQRQALTPLDRSLPPDLAAALAPHMQEALNHPIRRATLRTLQRSAEPRSLAELALTVPSAGVSVVGYHLHFLEHSGSISVTPARSADTATRRYTSNVSDDRQVVSVLRTTEPLDGVVG